MPRRSQTRSAALATPAVASSSTASRNKNAHLVVAQPIVNDDPFYPQVSLLRKQWKWATFSQFFYTFEPFFNMPDVKLSVSIHLHNGVCWRMGLLPRVVQAVRRAQARREHSSPSSCLQDALSTVARRNHMLEELAKAFITLTRYSYYGRSGYAARCLDASRSLRHYGRGCPIHEYHHRSAWCSDPASPQNFCRVLPSTSMVNLLCTPHFCAGPWAP